MRETQLTATASSRNGQSYEDLKTYCMFIGYPRSGHSLIGALLDAHPNMIIAHELDALKCIDGGFTDRQIYDLLLSNSQASAEAGRLSGKKLNMYSYAVPNQWQGRFQKLRIIGDKKGGGSTQRLRAQPELLERLRETIPLKIKFIHVFRDPYDNISTISRKKHLNLEDSIRFYFSLCEAVEEIKKNITTGDLFELSHESFIYRPQAKLKELCQFLSESASDDYLNDCASIVYKSPHRSRYDAQWNQKLTEMVKDRIAEFTFLEGILRNT